MSHTQHWWIAVWTMVFNHLWQSTVFAAFIGLCVLFLFKAQAKVRYSLWLLAALKFLVPASLLLPFLDLAGFDTTSIFITLVWASDDPVWLMDTHRNLFHVFGSFNPYFLEAQTLFAFLGSIWIAGAVALLAISIRRAYVFRRSVQQTIEYPAGAEAAVLSKVLNENFAGIRATLATTSAVSEPSVWGWRNPVILFPPEILSQLNAQELECILRHEVAHIKRRDNLVSLLQMLISAIFWFHPVVWLIGHRLLAERELACDDSVLTCGTESNEYAKSLAKVMHAAIGFRMAGMSYAGGFGLMHRIRRLKSLSHQTSMSHRFVVPLAVIAFILSSLAAVDIGDCRREIMKKRIYAEKKPCSGVSGTKSSLGT